jgi:uncharacterized protein (TIGR02246 family)
VLAGIVTATCVLAADKKAQKAGPEAARGIRSIVLEDKQNAQARLDKAAIRANAEAFIKAFNAHDAKGVAALWTPNGTVADEDGNRYRGRKAIEEQYAVLFKAHPTSKIQVAIESIEFPTGTTAIEEGESRLLTNDDSPPSAGRYTVVHVQEGGKWLMASVHESALPAASNFAHLEDLAWLLGDWQASAEGVVSRHRIRWIANKSFLQRDYSVHRNGMLNSSGTQIVGWDPRSNRIVSWSFDSSGGYGTGIWDAAPTGWIIESSGVTADGELTSSTDHVIRVPGDNNVFGFKSVSRKRGDLKLPDTPEVVLDRVANKP